MNSLDGRHTLLDATTFSVVRSRVNSIVEEMTYTLERSAFGSTLSLLHDYSCCIYDSQARQVASVDALPIQTNSMHLVLHAINTSFTHGTLYDGDLIMVNDAYRGNTHSADLVTASPVFIDGVHRFWSIVRGHQLDMGAPNPHASDGAARSVWQEGLTIPPIKLYERSQLRADVLDLYLSNLRYRETVEGDLMAHCGAVWTGVQRLRELCEQHGTTTIDTFVDEVIEYARRRTDAEIRTMPDGRYVARGWLDTDGSEVTDQEVVVAVTIDDTRISVDFSGSASAGAHGLNSSYATMLAAGSIPILMALDPDIPLNQGCLDAISVSAPEGTVCNARFPSSTAEATTHPADLMQDVVAMALGQAIPARARSGSARWSNNPMLSGVDERTGEAWAHSVSNGGGGGPAAQGADGWPVIIGMAAFGALKCASIEQSELRYPMQFLQCEVEIDSMGLGEHIGGPGIRLMLTPTAGQIEAIYTSDGLVNPPFGFAGGTPGDGGGSYVDPRTSAPRRFLHCPLAPETIKLGEVWVGVSSGGGGWGDPLDRLPQVVADDVRDGFVSWATAAEVFGVLLNPAGDVDHDATESRRQEILDRRSGPLPMVAPVRPRASDWYRRNMTEADIFITPLGHIGNAPSSTSMNQWSGAIGRDER